MFEPVVDMVQGVLGVHIYSISPYDMYIHIRALITCTVQASWQLANCLLSCVPTTQPVSGVTQQGVVVERLIHIRMYAYVRI